MPLAPSASDDRPVAPETVTPVVSSSLRPRVTAAGPVTAALDDDLAVTRTTLSGSSKRLSRPVMRTVPVLVSCPAGMFRKLPDREKSLHVAGLSAAALTNTFTAEVDVSLRLACT